MGEIKRDVILLFLLFYVFFSLPFPTLLAQSLDLSPDLDLFAPTIKHTRPEQSIKAQTPLSLEAVVTDNDAVNEVILYFRTAEGEETYKKIQMKSDGGKTYSISMPKEEILPPGFEYYIQASDKTGNIIFRGLSFSPLTIVVSPLSLEETIPPLPPPPVSKKRRALPPPSF